MSEKLFCFEHGYCRGEPFGTKKTLDVDFVVKVLETASGLADEDEVEEYIDKAIEEYFGKRDFDITDILWTLYSGEGWMCDGPNLEDLNERIEKIKNGTRFGLEEEESIWGFGPSRDEAKAAYAEVEGGQDDEDDWD